MHVEVGAHLGARAVDRALDGELTARPRQGPRRRRRGGDDGQIRLLRADRDGVVVVVVGLVGLGHNSARVHHEAQVPGARLHRRGQRQLGRVEVAGVGACVDVGGDLLRPELDAARGGVGGAVVEVHVEVRDHL